MYQEFGYTRQGQPKIQWKIEFEVIENSIFLEFICFLALKYEAPSD